VMAKAAQGFTVHEMESGRELASFPGCGEPDRCAPSRDGKMMARWSSIGATMYASGNSSKQYLSLPNLGVGTVSAVAPTRDGFVIANGDDFAGVVTAGTSEARAFATDLTSIRAIAVSNDGRLVTLGDSEGNVEVLELR
jgi:tricorn protease-like protein